jgi:hypothetical protein
LLEYRKFYYLGFWVDLHSSSIALLIPKADR